MATADNEIAAHRMAQAILYTQAYGGEMPKHPRVPDDEIVAMAKRWDETVDQTTDYDRDCLTLIESYTPIAER